MKTYKIGQTEYTIPTTWYDINYKKFLDMKDLESRADKYDDLDFNIEYISLVTDIPDDILLSMELNELQKLLIDIYTFSRTELPILNDIIYEIDGVTYVQDTDLTKCSFGQFIDLESFMKDGSIWDNAHKVTASFLRRSVNTRREDMYIKGRKALKKTVLPSDYKIAKYDYNQLLIDAEIFLKKLPVPYIYGIIVFFLIFANKSQKNIVDSFPKV